MTTTFQISEAELNTQFLRSLKSMFKDKNITITVETEDVTDETTYLMKSPTNHERLLKAIKNVNEGKNLVALDLNELKKVANA